MRSHPQLRRHSVLALACGALALLSTFSFAQETPPANQPVAPAAAAVAPAPAAPVAPAAAVTPPAARKEETAPVLVANTNVLTTPPATPPPTPLASRVTAMLSAMRGNGAPVQAIAERDRTISAHLATIAERDKTISAHAATIANLTAELHQHRSDRASLEAAVAALESKQTGVEETVSALGFPSAKLPAAGSLENAVEGSAEGLLEKFKAEQDPLKKADIAAQMRTLREQSAKAKKAA